MQPKELDALFQQHLSHHFPKVCYRRTIAGHRLEELDGDLCLHVQRFLNRRFDPRRVPFLAGLCREVEDVVLPSLEGEAREYFQRALQMAQMVCEHSATRDEPGAA